MTQQRFTATATDAARGRVRIPIPFHPDTVWGAKPGHHIHGTVNGMSMRGVVDAVGDGFALGPAWLRCCHLAAGNTATVDIEPEGPQRDDLADDVAAALRANPHAAAFFDSLAQFYRRLPALDRRHQVSPHLDPVRDHRVQGRSPANGRRTI